MCGSPVQAGNKLALTNLSLVGNRVGVVAANSFIDWNSIVNGMGNIFMIMNNI